MSLGEKRHQEDHEAEKKVLLVPAHCDSVGLWVSGATGRLKLVYRLLYLHKHQKIEG